MGAVSAIEAPLAEHPVHEPIVAIIFCGILAFVFLALFVAQFH